MNITIETGLAHFSHREPALSSGVSVIMARGLELRLWWGDHLAAEHFFRGGVSTAFWLDETAQDHPLVSCLRGGKPAVSIPPCAVGGGPRKRSRRRSVTSAAPTQRGRPRGRSAAAGRAAAAHRRLNIAAALRTAGTGRGAAVATLTPWDQNGEAMSDGGLTATSAEWRSSRQLARRRSSHAFISLSRCWACSALRKRKPRSTESPPTNAILTLKNSWSIMIVR